MKQAYQYVLASILLFLSAQIAAVELKIFSGGPFEAAFHELAKEYESRSGHRLIIEYGTAPQLQKKLADNAPGDLMLTATNLMNRPENQAKLIGTSMAFVGKGGVGIMVRKGANISAMNTTQAFTNQVSQAERLIYNRASTGLYMDQLFKRLGLSETLEIKTERFTNGDDAIQRVIRGSGQEIGFAAIAEIKMNEPKGIMMLGSLPDEYQNYTSYSAAIMKSSAHPRETQEFITFLQSDKVKAVFKRTGID